MKFVYIYIKEDDKLTNISIVFMIFLNKDYFLSLFNGQSTKKILKKWVKIMNIFYILFAFSLLLVLSILLLRLLFSINKVSKL